MAYRNQRYQVPNDFKKWVSPYQMDSSELQNLVSENVKASFTQVLDLTKAQAPGNPLQISLPGRGFKVRGIDSTTVYSFSDNTGIETAKTAAIVGCWINKIGGPSDAIFLKHGDGFHGDFLNLYLFWPAQTGINMRLTVFNFNDLPFIAGDPST